MRHFLMVFCTVVVLVIMNGSASGTSVVGDFDGDGVTDAAVYENATGHWFIVRSTLGFTSVLNFGGPGFVPVAGDYDGDDITDVAVYETATGHWFAIGSTMGFFNPALSFGGVGFVAIPGDFDGDGITDPSVFHEQTGNWFSQRSTAGFATPALNFGGLQYTPGGNATPAGLPNVQGSYNGNSTVLQALCISSADDGNINFPTSYNVNSQNGSSFGGTGTLTLGNVTNSIALSGTTTTNGDLEGTFTLSVFENAVLVASGNGTFNGQLDQEHLDLNFEGQLTSGDTCVFRGSSTVNR